MRNIKGCEIMKKLRAYIIAEKWFNGPYCEQLARMAASIQLVDFNDVSAEYGRLYEEMEVGTASRWN